ncbi:MAG TPA: response regulator [Puia sp.]|jgi:two-component system OmpR family response regulator|nr:response regulator [Puia sp.]
MQNNRQSKVLIVDDEPDICFLFGKILKMRNLRTDFANNLAEASLSVQADPPSLVFLDNSLPDGQGIDFISFLKEHYPGTRIIIVTANDGSMDKIRAFQRGADDFLGKPLSLELINRTLDKIDSRYALYETFPAL